MDAGGSPAAMAMEGGWLAAAAGAVGGDAMAFAGLFSRVGGCGAEVSVPMALHSQRRCYRTSRIGRRSGRATGSADVGETPPSPFTASIPRRMQRRMQQQRQRRGGDRSIGRFTAARGSAGPTAASAFLASNKFMSVAEREALRAQTEADFAAANNPHRNPSVSFGANNDYLSVLGAAEGARRRRRNVALNPLTASDLHREMLREREKRRDADGKGEWARDARRGGDWVY